MNVYYDPEKFGLTKVAEIDTAGGYEFDITVVFRKEDGSFWYAQDSGCSCPTPFEDHGLDSLTPVTDLAALSAAVTGYEIDAQELGSFIDEVRAAQVSDTRKGDGDV